MKQEINSACARLLKHATEKVWRRGEQYADDGRITILKASKKAIMALAKGTEEYKVELSMAIKNVNTHCSCPYQGIGVCKHVVAAAIIWDEKMGIKRPDDKMIAEKTASEPDTNTRKQVRDFYAEPLKANLYRLRNFSKEFGTWTRPHSILPDIPAIDLATSAPLSMKEIGYALKQMIKWSKRKTYDHYFCAGEMIAAFCMVISVIKARLKALDINEAADILLYAQEFHNKELLQVIDDSENMRTFSEAYLDDLKEAIVQTKIEDIHEKLDRYKENRGNY